MRMRLTAEHADTGAIKVLATSRSPKLLAQRILRDEDLWDRLGWESFEIEDDSLGDWSGTLREHLDSLRSMGDLDRFTWKLLREMV